MRLMLKCDIFDGKKIIFDTKKKLQTKRNLPPEMVDLLLEIHYHWCS